MHTVSSLERALPGPERIAFLSALRKIFTRAELLHAGLLVLLITLSALLETVGFGLLIPFFAYLADPQSLVGNRWAQPLLAWMNHRGWGPAEGTLFLSCGIIAFYTFKSGFAGYLAFLVNRFTFAKYRTVARDSIRAYLNLPYASHLSRSTADLIAKSGAAEVLIISVIAPSFSLLTESAVFILLFAMMLAMQPVPLLITLAITGLPAMLFLRVFRERIRVQGEAVQRHYTEVIKVLTQMAGGMKEIKLRNIESFFSQQFSNTLSLYAHSRESSFLLVQLPKYFLEAFAVLGIVTVALTLKSQTPNSAELLATLAFVGLAFARTTPAVTRIMSSLTQIRASRYALDNFVADLQRPQSAAAAPLTQERPLAIQTALEIRGISFSYDGVTPVLQDLTVKIPCGASVGFIGQSGAGKSTLIDLICGLIEPQNGAILCDDQDIRERMNAWQRSIGYVPQNPYLLDDTIARNVAFGVPDEARDEKRVWEALEIAQVANFVRTLPGKLETIAGERGARLSGGQRQRLVIARALYFNPAVLILDEATAALDRETETDLTAAIEGLAGKVTSIIITHRLSTLKACDRIYQLNAGRIEASGTFAEMVTHG